MPSHPSALSRRWIILGAVFCGQAVAGGLERAALLPLAPLSFEPNLGQVRSPAPFLMASGGHMLEFRPDSVVLQAGLEIRFLGAARQAGIRGGSPLAGVHNYYLGTGTYERVPQFGTLRYTELYPGTDLVFYGKGDQLEYDFELAPGADPGAIRFRFAGAQRVHVDGNGDLLIESGGKRLRHGRPVSYQMVRGVRVAVESGFVLDQRTGELRFAVGAYDRSLPLTIDPILTFFWRSFNSAVSSAVDPNGNVYLTGSTAGTPANVFVKRLNSSGVQVYETTLGGSSTEDAGDIAADTEGNAYITGRTYSTDFSPAPANPILWQTITGNARRGNTDAFVVKLNATGQSVFSTYLGGNGDERGKAIAVDPSGAKIVASGSSTSTDLPGTPDPIDNHYVIEFSVSTAPPAVSKFQQLGTVSRVVRGADGSTYLIYVVNRILRWTVGTSGGAAWAMWLGGSELASIRPTDGYADADGNLYVAGYVTGSGLPITTNGLIKTRSGTDGFVVKIQAGGVTYGTYVGGSGSDHARSVTVDSQGNIYVAGQYSSAAGFPTANGQPAPYSGGAYDIFVAKIRPETTKSTLLFSYFLGSPNDTTAGSTDGPVPGMLLDANGALFLAGNIGTFPVMEGCVIGSSGCSPTTVLGAPWAAGMAHFVAKFAKADIRARVQSFTLPPQDPVTPEPGVALNLSRSSRRKAGVTPGEIVEFTGDFINQPVGAAGTSSAASKLQVSASLPPSLEIAPVGSACTFNGQSCGTQVTGFQAPVVDTVAVDQTVGLSVKLRVEPAGSADSPVPGSTITFSFTGNAETDDPDPSNNTVSQSFKVNVPVSASTAPVSAPVTISNTKGEVLASGPGTVSRWMDPEAGYALSVNPLVAGSAGTRFRFVDWLIGSDHIATATVNIPVPVWPAETMQANYRRQFQVTASPNDPARGSVAVSSADGYFDESSNATVAATAAPGYQFSSFSGSITSTTNPATFPVTGVMNIVANFILPPPPAPLNPTPANGAANAATNQTLGWSASTGATSYDVYFGTSNAPPLAGNTAGTTYNPGALAAGTLYYWKVAAKNAGGAAASATWSFTTAPANCSYSLSFLTREQPPAGGSSTGTVVTDASCPWTAASDSPWLMISGGTGPGINSFTYSAAPNPGRARMATVSTGTQAAKISQRGNPSTLVFNDVPSTLPYFDYISLLNSEGITAGCWNNPPLYCPDTPVTRAQMAVFIVAGLKKRMNVPPHNPVPYFEDMPASSNYFPFVQAIKELNITAGCSATPALFCPNNSITHGQTAVFMVLSWMRANNLADFTYAPTPYFADVPLGHPFFKFIQKARDLGLRTSCGSDNLKYCPDAQVTRAEMAPLILRALLGAP